MSAQTPEQYRGQWGGKTESGEEMWWSEPNVGLTQGKWRARYRFWLDVRQHFILRFWKRWRAEFPLGKPFLGDYGCGTGGVTQNFARFIGHPITGFDIFETQLKIAREFAAKHGNGCEFRMLEKGGRFPLADGALDALFSLDVLGHVPSIPDTLKEWHRVLNPKHGAVFLFTESDFSPGDRSLMANLARVDGIDMGKMVEEHISLFPREALEKMFSEAGFEVVERFSANTGHFFFFPKDYVLLLKGRGARRGLYALAWVWNRISKVTPFYPGPFHLMRMIGTYLFGRAGYGTGYFYYLRKKA